MPKKYIIRKGYGKWSGSTVVEGPTELPKSKDELVAVLHPSSRETFNIPAGYLTAKRYR